MAVLRALALAVLMLAAVAPPALAQRAEAVVELLRLDEVLEIMRVEGMAHGAAIGEGLLGPGDDAAWTAAVARVYDPERMRAAMRPGLEGGLTGAAMPELQAFFTSDLGRRVVALEVSARRAMLDTAIEEVARAEWADLSAEGGPRVAALRRFVDVGDLVEQNVAGGLNATYAFYVGLRDSGADAGGLGAAEMLADVRGQEAAIRAEIDGWLHAYIALAFGPLEDRELHAYTDFLASPAGQTLNTALFAGFNGMFETLSRRLGRAAGGLMLGEDL